jgi:hypothetical protein
MNWTAIGVVVTIIIAVISGGYVLYEKYYDLPIVRACRGEDRGKCAQHDMWMACEEVAAWGPRVCKRKFQIMSVENDHDGNRCGYTTFRIKCGE